MNSPFENNNTHQERNKNQRASQSSDSNHKRSHKTHQRHYQQYHYKTSYNYESSHLYSMSRSKSRDRKHYQEYKYKRNTHNVNSNGFTRIENRSSSNHTSKKRQRSYSSQNAQRNNNNHYQNSKGHYNSYKKSRSRSKSHHYRRNLDQWQKSYAKSKQYKKSKRYRSISSSNDYHKKQHRHHHHSKKYKKRSQSYENQKQETFRIYQQDKEKYQINYHNDQEQQQYKNNNKSPEVQYNYKSSSQSQSHGLKKHSKSQQQKSQQMQFLQIKKNQYNDLSHSQRESDVEIKKQKKHKNRSYSSSKSSKSSQKPDSSSSASSDNKHRLKDAGHYEFQVGEKILNKYQILNKIADGTFGRVFKVLSLEDEKQYALKMIRAVPRYIKSAKIEVHILKDILSKNDGTGREFIVDFKEAFDFKDNYCMVFELLGLSLYEFQKKNDYKGFPITYVQSFFKQILQSIKFLHDSGLVHTDLKTENVILQSSKYKYARHKSNNVDSNNFHHDADKKSVSSTCSQSIEKNNNQRHYYEKFIVPKYTTVKLIDFGGAIYDDEYHSAIINTRQYRAPEVILGLSWDNKTDVWSIACIILELYSGDLYFPTHENYEHLAMIQKSSGNYPQFMINRCSEDMEKYFSQKHAGGSYYLNWPKLAKNSDTIKRVARFKTIDDIISKKYPELIDLLKQMLIIDPKERISCTEALKHKFFTKTYKNEFYFC